ncbi:hypothetical protein EYF80_028568 [Liparis tanakae]|uniref:Uncharacterized protein n=1 Tax=Liparis tanakae TaxID=230148 RepID=A0A4Z2H835_9TELE|nr:hypothetical protein EYF80_028568 [Liparis tanakae]
MRHALQSRPFDHSLFLQHRIEFKAHPTPTPPKALNLKDLLLSSVPLFTGPAQFGPPEALELHRPNQSADNITNGCKTPDLKHREQMLDPQASTSMPPLKLALQQNAHVRWRWRLETFVLNPKLTKNGLRIYQQRAVLGAGVGPRLRRMLNKWKKKKWSAN